MYVDARLLNTVGTGSVGSGVLRRFFVTSIQEFPICPVKRPLFPTVTHVDGSGRLHTVTREVPMVLNTSFNENEPVVCKPKEELDCYLRTPTDVLVMGKYYIQRTQPH